jgi:transposase
MLAWMAQEDSISDDELRRHFHLAGPSLLAHVLVSKYSDHLPLYRQAENYELESFVSPRPDLSPVVISPT